MSSDPASAATPTLTSLSHGAGCACKIGAAELSPVLARLPRFDDPRLIAGYEGAEDAAAVRVSGELAIVSTADFFTPIVDDPFEFGRIAATNALSDAYAMGAEPVVAINLLAFSLETLGEEVMLAILRGGAETAARAGIAIGGGHSIDDPEPKYGLAVTATAHPDRLLRNSGGRGGDALVLTKPLGGGLITTATKRGIAPESALAAAVEVMTTLNADASRAAMEAGARAATDVTGFGLLGHVHELAEASGLAARIDSEAVPAIDGALELAARPEALAGGSRRNAKYAAGFTTYADGIDARRRVLVSDAMTSGGLLVAVAPEHASRIPGTRIGELRDGEPGAISVG
ncbi:selenide, water dikinase SelD [Thermoleophilia bacterium SCSIO 60948]|nr:selenide, water dikinase SelD [Thermoleophilia bacterium SCSIO 60948]